VLTLVSNVCSQFTLLISYPVCQKVPLP